MQKRLVRRAAWLSGAGALALALLAFPAAGTEMLVPQGTEFQVNTYTALFQESPSVAADADGNFVVVWSCDGASGTDTGSLSIQGRRYTSDGTALGEQFQVNTYTTGDQKNPSVAADAGGDFVVVWESNGSDGPDTQYRSVQGQRFASDGSPQGAQFQVNTYSQNSQIRASVAADADGDFVVVWQSNGSSGTDTDSRSIQGQRYDSVGSPQGAEFQVNTYTSHYQRSPSVAADADGDFVVVWESYGSSGTDRSGYSIQGQRYASAGSAEGAEFQVNSFTLYGQIHAAVAAEADGDFVVVWESYGSSGTDGSGYSIQGQRYASGGSAAGAEFQVNSYTTSDQEYPSVGVSPDGDFVVMWDSAASYGPETNSDSIQGQRYDAGGSPQGAQFQANTYTTSQQYSVSLAEADGHFVVVWRSDGSSGTDASDSSIQGQRYGVATAVPAMSPATRFGLAAALLLGASYTARRA